MIGPTFAQELIAAGLGGSPCTWGGDGSYEIAQLNDAQKQTFLQVLRAHDPTKQIAVNPKVTAQAALDETDLVAIRCWKAAIPFPSDWLSYVNALRAVMRDPTQPLPIKPQYPAGT